MRRSGLLLLFTDVRTYRALFFCFEKKPLIKLLQQTALWLRLFMFYRTVYIYGRNISVDSLCNVELGEAMMVNDCEMCFHCQ